MKYSHAPAWIFAAILSSSSIALAEDWPGWRGADRTDISREKNLLKKWPEGGPKQLWTFKNAGNGYSGPAIVNDRLYTLGTRDNKEILLCLDASKGTELWATPIGDVLQNDWGNGPRGTPAIDGSNAYALSGQGALVCVNATTGKIFWQTSMADLGGKTPGWGYTESVLVDGNRVLCTPGGSKGTVAAFDKKSGTPLWQSKDFTDSAHYSSIIAVDLNGDRQYIQRTEKNVVGLSAKDGSVLWKTSFEGRTAVIPTPLFKDGMVYVTAAYGAGCKMVKIGANNQVTVAYENKVMKNHHGGVVLVGDHVYGHSDGSGWMCQDLKTGEEVWMERAALGKGAVSVADGMLYCIDERSGAVVLAEASPSGWKEHGRFTLAPQTTIRASRGAIWTHPVISGGRLFLRDQDIIHCYNIRTP